MDAASAGKLTSLIHSYYPSLTKSEQKVASTVLSDIESVLYSSVTDLADKSGVGETTALRFCRKMGYKGYQEFKLAIAKDLSGTSVGEGDKEEEDSNSVPHSIAKYAKNALDETLQLIEEDTIERCLDALQKANHVYFFGVATSGITAQDAKLRFLRTGLRTDAITDPHVQSMTASTLGVGDVVVGISFSGSTKDTVDAVQLAKENGATIIVLTYYARSPITKLADYVLLNSGKQSPFEGGSISAKISQLYVIDILCTGLAVREKEAAIAMKKKTADAVVDKSY
ncbi:MurR/RpiR family transcriptional regulator [Pontibacillus salicampi]|uniref:MurR/RpiR family transcriptional regulator n=1 Tax=Pontibacillus salicampi TaxID=1449801 RepID=A0ABV6LSJ4_9BACI